jgi:hypothetical protein
MPQSKQPEERRLVAEVPFVAFVDGRVVHVGEGEVVSSSDPVAESGKPYLREVDEAD